ncbi:uncharacterized protein TrAFT101_000921 [Trichoderma asperellum]|uniref:Uncharacterized protein n=1 Tax=Trichoderma asperellum (strain ATCC 204424 / CBS 433.97 / NBRC 101777) TaxID=1042311 RepID=A0A2T3ZKY1_TRIA4|nr:hypothetical protein M441DRAFT_23673 [Trichoderma asperellum CBS 433.97]PTB45478.1 hypothetical protein M441DRAFT_23673 [Trichoderma asperellum CBS 433.97]UKZ85045.1 hypothetical protein TrAFT101_000921 [Trichoderma asperellum]
MPPPAARGGWSVSQLWRDDEEMANKKDDDLGLPRHTKHADHWQPAPKASLGVASVLRLVLYAVVFFLTGYGLFRVIGPAAGASSLDPANLMPMYDRPRPPPRYDTPRMEEDAPIIKTPKTPKPQAKPNDGGSKAAADPSKPYNGPLKLPHLGPSLEAIMLETQGRMQKNRNVLFSAASLKSAALLLPMACQMATERQNYVHFALMSRSDISIKELLAINGIDKSCPLVMHDARPDHSTTTAEPRMTFSVTRALYYINLYMHPQVVIIDSSSTEESYFLSGIRDKIRDTEATLIEVSEKTAQRFSWLSKLDSSALAAWNEVNFDIIIQAPRHGAGNLKRLLRSLARTDMAGVSPPHLTIELPSTVEEDLTSFLNGYEWPPKAHGVAPKTKLLSLRRRIPRHKMSEEESSVRFLESFWPAKPFHSHVIVLSPHTEVTSQFFHYVKYSILQRRYSTIANRQHWENKLFGISLSAPTAYLDDTTQFTPPKPLEEQGSNIEGTPFLWQVPSSDAILIFGDKWVELHGYVSQLLEKQHASSTTPDLFAKKKISTKHPAWLEYILQLSRLRGYFTLYPTRQTANTIVGIHTDLYDVPEEYEQGKTAEQEQDLIKLASDGFDPASHVDVLATLPHEGDLPLLYHMPWLTWDGKNTDDGAIEKTAAKYKQAFRTQIGGCKDESAGPVPAVDPNARDLFCFTNGR